MNEPEKSLIPKGGGPEVRLPAEVVRTNVATVIAQMPDMLSYDPTTDQGEMLSLKCAVDPGITAQKRDGWRGTVTQWGVSAYEVTDETSGEIVTLPSLCLMTEDGELCRLTGWPAIRSWAAIVRAMGKERCQLGVSVVVKRRQSGTAGRSYWIVVPDA